MRGQESLANVVPAWSQECRLIIARMTYFPLTSLYPPNIWIRCRPCSITAVPEERENAISSRMRYISRLDQLVISSQKELGSKDIPIEPQANRAARRDISSRQSHHRESQGGILIRRLQLISMRERLSCAVLNLDTLQTQSHTFHIPIVHAGTEDALTSPELQSSHGTLYSDDLRFVDANYIELD
jgi:hypothetical protein